MKTQSPKNGTWKGCYDSGWQGEIIPESFGHPAKFSRTLIQRIYQHALAEGWLEPGMTVLDPFGGVALGALDAMWNGLNWVGVELEPKFVDLAAGMDCPGVTREQWKRFHAKPRGAVAAKIRWCPRCMALKHYTDTPNKSIESIIKLGDGRPNARGQKIPSHEAHRFEGNLALWQRKYGSKAGWGSARIIQGDSRKLGEVIAGADCCIGSPPYASGEKGHPSLGSVNNDDWGNDGHDITRRRGKTGKYGETEGQLGSLPEGRFEAMIGSPPYEGSLQNQRASEDANQPKVKEKRAETKGKVCWGANADGSRSAAAYGIEQANIGNQSGSSFWSAAREILLQCRAILKPGGHAIWVCKDFVRKGKRVPFSDQWQALCESVGFRLVCRHRAMLVANHGAQETIFGETEQLKTERKSFFRRLHERKHPGTEINWEDILCLIK